MLGSQFDTVLAAAQTGAEWAWSLLYHDLAGQVLGYLRARGSMEPEDVTGEVFLQVARGIGSFAGDEKAFRSWVFTIVHRRLIDERRRRYRRPVEVDDDLESIGGIGDVEGEALQALARDEVRELIQRLTPQQRDVLLLRIMGGFTVDEVAGMVGKRPGAVKALQRRGLRAIQKQLAGPAASPEIAYPQEVLER